MDILIQIDKLDDVLFNAKPIPLTEQVVIDRKQIFDILDQMRASLPEELKQARWIVKGRHDGPGGAGDGRLEEIVSSIEELKRAQRASPPPLTAAAAEQVRTIVEAAETSAAEVRADAESEAKQMADAAAKHNLEVRQTTAAESAARLGRAEEATDGMVSDARAVSAQVAQLIEGLRAPVEALEKIVTGGASSLSSDFDQLRKRLAEVEGVATKLEEHAPKVVDDDEHSDVEHAVRRRFRKEEDSKATRALQHQDTQGFDALPGDDDYVSAGRLSGPPALNSVTHRHLKEDQT